jgi:hypothetical protein
MPIVSFLKNPSESEKLATAEKKDDFDSNEIHENKRPYEKHDEQRISTLRGIKID